MAELTNVSEAVRALLRDGDEVEPRPGGVVLPAWTIHAVAVAPAGTYPSYAHGLTDRDNGAYRGWDRVSRDRDAFTAWMRKHVLEPQAIRP